MSTITATIQNAQDRAAEIRPRVGGLPVLAAIWSAGVTAYVVDLDRRTVTYRGIDNVTYVERYPAVQISPTG